MDFKYVTQEERERLYNEVWTDPVTIVAPRYNISDTALRKNCRRLWIPVPSIGYWSKLKAGKKVFKPDLPKVRGELKKYVHCYVIKYKSNVDKYSDDELKDMKGLSLLTDDTIQYINKVCSDIEVKKQLRNPHKLIKQHKIESTYRKKRDKELQQASFNIDYYNVTKNKYRENEAMLPVWVSEINLNRSYRILNALIFTIEDLEGCINIGIDSSEKDKGYFCVMKTYFYFEMTEEKQKKNNNEELVPNLVLSFNVEGWYFDSNNYQLKFKDKVDEPLENQLGSIILQMLQTANKILIEGILKDREEEREAKERERQIRLEQMRKGELEEIKILQQAASDWNKAEEIRKFINQMELKIKNIEDEDKRRKLFNWLKWARDKADWLDPLTDKEDELLGKSKHIFEEILET